MTTGNNNNKGKNMDNLLDAMFDVTPAKVKSKLEGAYERATDNRFSSECANVYDEIMDASPRGAWNRVKRPFTKKNK